MYVRYLVGPFAQVLAKCRQIEVNVCGEGLPCLQRPYPKDNIAINHQRHNPHDKYAIAVLAAVGNGVSLIISSAVGARSLSGSPYRSFDSLLYSLPMLEWSRAVLFWAYAGEVVGKQHHRNLVVTLIRLYIHSNNKSKVERRLLLERKKNSFML